MQHWIDCQTRRNLTALPYPCRQTPPIRPERWFRQMVRFDYFHINPAQTPNQADRQYIVTAGFRGAKLADTAHQY